MQRVKWAAFLLLFLLLLSVLGQWFVYATAQDILSFLDSVESAYQSGHFTEVPQQVGRLEEYCRKREHLLTLILRKEQFSALLLTCAALPAYADEQSAQDFYAELYRARTAATAFCDMI